MPRWSHLSHFYTLEAHTKEKTKQQKQQQQQQQRTKKRTKRVTQPLTHDDMVTSQPFLHA